MNQKSWLLRVALLFSLVLTGCGDSVDEFVFTGNQGQNPTRQVTINQVLAQTVQADVVAFAFSGVDANGAVVYGPEQFAKSASITVQIPTTVVEFRIAYLDANGATIGIYQETLPEGTGAVVISSPDYIPLDAFIISLAINPATITLEIGDTEVLTVTALLSDNSDADVTALANLASSNAGVASLNGTTLTAASLGSTQITATLLNRSDTSPVTVTLEAGTVEVNAQSTTVEVGDTLQMQANRVVGQVETDITGDVTWDSESDAIATVDQNGLVTAVAVGQVDISAFDAQTGETGVLTITVEDTTFLFGLISSIDGIAIPDNDSQTASISDDARYVAFESNANGLVTGDMNGLYDIFVKDRETGAITIVSKRSNDTFAAAGSDGAQISGNGRYVIFESNDDLQVGVDTNGFRDVYLYDLQEEELELISTNTAGTAASNGSSGVYGGTITADGRYVLFYSAGTNLVSSPVVAANNQVYLRDRQTGTTELISQSTGGTVGGSDSYVYLDGISADGRYVTFYSFATNLDTAVTDNSGNGYDSFLRDRTLDTTVMISTNAAGTAAADGETYVTWMSDDGQTILVSSDATDLTSPVTPATAFNIYRYSVGTGAFELLTSDDQGDPIDGNCYEGVLDAQQRFLLFASASGTFFDPADKDQVVIRELSSGDYQIVSSDAQGDPGNGGSYSYGHAMTPDGEDIVFESGATDLGVQAVVSAFSQVYSAPNPFLQN